MAITNLSTVKTVLGITDSSKDSIICELIPLVEDDYLAIRNVAFEEDDDDETVYPTGSELTAIQMIAFHLQTINKIGVASESLGDHSISFASDSNGGYPVTITNKIKRFAKFL